MKKMPVQYLVCLNFEATCWPNNCYREHAEIIEFPAVLLNVCMGRIESEFHRFVRPKKHPKLSTCCIQLTGITQQQIDQSNPFPEVYQDFLKWLDELTNRKQLVFYTKENFKRQVGQNVTFCSWSSFDMRHYFQLGMVRHEIDRPDNMGIWIDMQHEIQKENGGRWRFDRALQRLNTGRKGRAPTGIDDARNLAKFVAEMTHRGVSSFTIRKL